MNIIDFEKIYEDIIRFIKSYNRIQIDNKELFDEINYLHIKGGASIKYHLNEAKILTKGITNDIDILFLIDNIEEKEERINTFFSALTNHFKNFNWDRKISNGLYVIQKDNINLIDITIYDPNFDIKDETSIFGYALQNLGFSDIKQYYNTIVKSDNIELISFTSLKFELFSTEKAIQVYENYIKNIPNWQRTLIILTRKKKYLEKQKLIDQKEIIKIDKIITGYKKQLQPEYIKNLHNKLHRYKYKNKALNTIYKSLNQGKNIKKKYLKYKNKYINLKKLLVLKTK